MADTLGVRLRELRQRQGLTLAALASGAVVSVSYLNDIEHDRTVPSLRKLTDIASALGMTVRDLLIGVAPYDEPQPTTE